MPLDHDDRRKLVLDVATSKKGDHAYFDDLTQALQEGELSAFLYDALREDLTGFNRRNVYKTRARTEVADTTASLETSFLVHVLEQGVLPGEQWTPKPMSAIGGWIAVKGNAWPKSEVAILDGGALHGLPGLGQPSARQDEPTRRPSYTASSRRGSETSSTRTASAFPATQRAGVPLSLRLARRLPSGV